MLQVQFRSLLFYFWHSYLPRSAPDIVGRASQEGHCGGLQLQASFLSQSWALFCFNIFCSIYLFFHFQIPQMLLPSLGQLRGWLIAALHDLVPIGNHLLLENWHGFIHLKKYFTNFGKKSSKFWFQYHACCNVCATIGKARQILSIQRLVANHTHIFQL